MIDFKTKYLERLRKYTAVNTQSDPASTSVPTTKGQLELANLLVKELEQIGTKNTQVDEYGYVTATIPSNIDKKVPIISFLAHMDTSPDASGENVKLQIHKNYGGDDIVINKDLDIILSPKDSPELLDYKGDDIITASGDTLLGGDNKSGIAVIMCMAEHLINNPEIKHGEIKIGFTIDEEVGRGVDNFDVKKFGADYAYTVDGGLLGEVDNESFNADSCLIEIEGKSYHPGAAKGLMQNALRIASDIISSWPEDKLPETTEKREGFICFMEGSGSVEKAEIKGIIRNHDISKLEEQKKLLQDIIDEKQKKYPKSKIKLTINEQYRNMREVLDKPENKLVMENLDKALKKNDIEMKVQAIRGGTDGSRLSFMGLPTPNIFCGPSNLHGKYEWISLNTANSAVNVLIDLSKTWAE